MFNYNFGLTTQPCCLLCVSQKWRLVNHHLRLVVQPHTSAPKRDFTAIAKMAPHPLLQQTRSWSAKVNTTWSGDLSCAAQYGTVLFWILFSMENWPICWRQRKGKWKLWKIDKVENYTCVLYYLYCFFNYMFSLTSPSRILQCFCDFCDQNAWFCGIVF